MSVILSTYQYLPNFGTDRNTVAIALASELVNTAPTAVQSAIIDMIKTVDADADQYTIDTVIDALSKVNDDKELPEIYVVPSGSNLDVVVKIPADSDIEPTGFARVYETETSSPISNASYIPDFLQGDGSVRLVFGINDITLEENKTYKCQVVKEQVSGNPGDQLIHEFYIVSQDSIDYTEKVPARYGDLSLDYDNLKVQLFDKETLISEVPITTPANIDISDIGNGIIEITATNEGFIVDVNGDGTLYEIVDIPDFYQRLQNDFTTLDSELNTTLTTEINTVKASIQLSNESISALISSQIQNGQDITSLQTWRTQTDNSITDIVQKNSLQDGEINTERTRVDQLSGSLEEEIIRITANEERSIEAKNIATSTANSFSQEISQIETNRQNINTTRTLAEQTDTSFNNLVTQRIDPIDGEGGSLETLESQISQNATNINLKVSKNDILTELNLKLGTFSINNADMQSGNFVQGVSGWIIREDGSVEFGNAILRGNVIGDIFGQDIELGSGEIHTFRLKSFSQFSDSEGIWKFTVDKNETFGSGGNAILQVDLDGIDFNNLPTSPRQIPGGGGDVPNSLWRKDVSGITGFSAGEWALMIVPPA